MMAEQSADRIALIRDAADLAGAIPPSLVDFCIVHDYGVEQSEAIFKQYVAEGYFLCGSSEWGQKPDEDVLEPTDLE